MVTALDLLRTSRNGRLYWDEIVKARKTETLQVLELQGWVRRLWGADKGEVWELTEEGRWALAELLRQDAGP